MILTELYPTSSNGQGYSLTASIETLSYGSNIDDPLKPYAMGYIKYEDYPKFYDLAEVTSVFDGNTNKLVVKSAIEPANHAWGYAAYKSPDTSYYEQTYRIEYDAVNNLWRAKQGNVNQGNIVLINQGYLAVYSVPNFIQLKVAISVTNDDNTKPNGTIVNGSIATINDYFMFCNGDIPLSFTFGGNTYDLYISDFDENGYVVLRNVADTATYVVAIVGFECTERGTGNTTSYPYVAISPWIKIDTDDKPLYQSYNKLSTLDCRIYTHNGTDAMEIVNNTSSMPEIYGYKWLYGLEGEITYQQTQTWAKSYDTEAWHYVAELNCFRNYTGSSSSTGYQWQLRPIFKPLHIRAYLSLRLKTNLASTASMALVPANLQYTTGVIVNKYDSSDVPTGDILNGVYQDIISELRPWQLWEVDIKTNTFDPSDIPPYKPTPGDDDDNTESGDKVPNQFGRTVGVTSNFITNYLMTEGQISKLGEVLWTSWADDAVTMDMVNNFYGKFHDSTGSWNVSDALQFIVSCRLFPCSLATLVDTTQVTSIPIGTGAFALQCGTQTEPSFFIANEATAILNCGDIYVPREYNDYRDFENTKITAYLPFCGSVELNPQDVVGKWLGCTYAIDLFDGSCKAFIYTLSGNDVGYEGAYYNVAIKQGQCGFLIPMSGTQAGQVASRQKVDGYTDGALLYQAAAGLMESAMALGGYSDANPVAGFNKMITAGTASSVLTAQRLGRAGISAPTTSGGSGFTDFHQPASAYVQIRRSYYQEPLQYEHSIGYPTNGAIYDNLSQFTGFIKCVNVDISGFTCHEDERSEIKALLESGVYL